MHSPYSTVDDMSAALLSLDAECWLCSALICMMTSRALASISLVLAMSRSLSRMIRLISSRDMDALLEMDELLSDGSDSDAADDE